MSWNDQSEEHNLAVKELQFSDSKIDLKTASLELHLTPQCALLVQFPKVFLCLAELSYSMKCSFQKKSPQSF